MQYLELCFHEQDTRLADLASRGLESVGACVLRRPVSAKHRPGVSPATRHRVILYSGALAGLGDDLAGLSSRQVSAAVAIPTDAIWPLRHSRPWVIAPPGVGAFETRGFWRLVSWAAQRPLDTTEARLAVQYAVFRGLRDLKAQPADRIRRRRPLAALLNLEPLKPVQGLRDWQFGGDAAGGGGRACGGGAVLGALRRRGGAT